MNMSVDIKSKHSTRPRVQSLAPPQKKKKKSKHKEYSKIHRRAVMLAASNAISYRNRDFIQAKISPPGRKEEERKGSDCISANRTHLAAAGTLSEVSQLVQYSS